MSRATERSSGGITGRLGLLGAVKGSVVEEDEFDSPEVEGRTAVVVDASVTEGLEAALEIEDLEASIV
jgi:hypothetical protein